MTQLAIDVKDPSQVAEARRLVSAAATAAGFGDVPVAQVALAVTELATNLLKHGGGGQLLAHANDDCVELLALDGGAGMEDVETCLVDGYSTAGTRGNGLGAVRRLAQHFEVASWPGKGTVVLAEIPRDGTQAKELANRDVPGVGVLAVPMRGESVSGDSWAAHVDATGRTLFVVDGLGHGTDAAVAANAAVTQFRARPDAAPADILEGVHRALRHTRGAAAAVARLAWPSRTVTFAGLGNIAASCVGLNGETRRMVSLNGIAGHNARKIQSFEYPCPEGILVMHSDGVGTSWSIDRYPGLLAAHPLVIAGVLYRDFARGRDDATILVARTGAR